MYALLQESVNTGVIDASGWVLGIGGLVLLAVWFVYLGR